MDIELLQYFVTVAETLSFKKAAEKLFISPATLSRGINALEKEIGIKLFDRTTRKVRINESGLILLEDARKLIRDYDALMLKIKMLNGDSAGTVRIGYFRNENAEYLARIVERIKRDYPAITIEYMKSGLQTLTEGLKNGFLDAILVYQSCIETDDTLEIFTIDHEYPTLIMCNDHRLAGKEYVDFGDLLEETVIIRDWKDIPETVNESMRNYFINHGIHIEARDSGFNWGQQMMRIRLGECIMLDAFSTSSIGQPDPFCVVPIVSEDPRFDRNMIIRKDNTNPLLFSLKDTVEKMIQEKAFH